MQTAMLVGVALVSIVSVTGNAQPARASAEALTFEVSVDDQANHWNMVAQAEQSAAAEISRQFQQIPGMTSLQLSVVVSRHGDVIPVFTTTVSREQWKRSPQVKQWSRYHDAYALLQRHQMPVVRPRPQVIASAPRPTDQARARIFTPAVDSAFDRGALRSKQTQNSLDYWD